MAALTCIPNPNTTITEPSEREYILFYLNSDNKVVWEIRNPDGSPGKKHNPTKNAPAFQNPSSFASIYHEQLISVYGIEATTGKICLLSPANSYVSDGGNNPTTKHGSLAATGNGKDLGWLYYLNDQDPAQIEEFAMQYSTASQVTGGSTPMEDTYLAAFYDPTTSERNVIYQTAKGLHVLNVQEQSDEWLKITANAKNNTPIAVSFVQLPSGTWVYLYYFDRLNTLQKVVRNPRSSWSGPFSPGDPPTAQDFTQLTCATNVEEGANHLFYAGSSGDGWVNFTDPFDSN